jgi:hypothetical protein
MLRAARCWERAPSTTSIADITDYSITWSARASMVGGTMRPSGTEIDDRLELGRAVDWCVRWLGAFEETAGEIPARR